MKLAEHDPRPDVWIGHVSLRVPEVAPVGEALLEVGMRKMELDAGFQIFELRGGTHLIVTAADAEHPAAERAPFDLMVDDVERAREHYTAAGLACSEIRRGSIHDSFELTLPGGCVVTVNSSHTVGLPV